ncbi:hypothetical protein BYI23_E001480 (plasmid) [Burkholderia sp. YI23]|nr:hypothetical protein BYI23_E001480 [Burkholderia sp. YI23]
MQRQACANTGCCSAYRGACSIHPGDVLMKRIIQRHKSTPVAEMIAKKVRIYDNGGQTADRYTAVYMFEPERNGLFGARGMDANPYHPQGIGMCCTAVPGRHLGRRVGLSDMPEACQRLIRNDVQSFLQATA